MGVVPFSYILRSYYSRGLFRGSCCFNHRVLFKLVGTTSNRADIGARVTVYASGVARVNEELSGGIYISKHDLRVHFGLGEVTKISRVVILWPNGKEEELKAVAAEAIYTVPQGSGITQTVSRPAVGTK